MGRKVISSTLILVLFVIALSLGLVPCAARLHDTACLSQCCARDAKELIRTLEDDQCNEIFVNGVIDLGVGLKKGYRIDLRDSKNITGVLTTSKGRLPEIRVGKQWTAGYIGDEPAFAVNLKGLINKANKPVQLVFQSILLVDVELGHVVEGAPRDISYTFNECVIQVSPSKGLESSACGAVNDALKGQKSTSTALSPSYHKSKDQVYPWDYREPHPLKFNGDAFTQARASIVVIQLTQGNDYLYWGILCGIGMVVLIAIGAILKLKLRPFQRSDSIYSVGGSRKTVRMTTKILGTGSYGTVKGGILTLQRNPCSMQREIQVAVKEVQRNQGSLGSNSAYWTMAEREIDFSNRCCHKNIVKCHGVVNLSSEEGIHYLIVMERLPKDLHKLIHGGGMFRRHCTYRELINMFLGIVSGLQYLHDEIKCIHFDLKPSNILLTDSNCCKLADFGMVKICNDGSVELTGTKGTRWYSAPEVWLLTSVMESQNMRVNTSIDIYSLGVVMWECVTRLVPGTREVPFREGQTPTIQMYSERVSFPLQCNCNSSLRKLIARCVYFDYDLFMGKWDAGEHASETFGRPSLGELKENFHKMLSEGWVDSTPPCWR